MRVENYISLGKVLHYERVVILVRLVMEALIKGFKFCSPGLDFDLFIGFQLELKS